MTMLRLSHRVYDKVFSLCPPELIILGRRSHDQNYDWQVDELTSGRLVKSKIRQLISFKKVAMSFQSMAADSIACPWQRNQTKKPGQNATLAVYLPWSTLLPCQFNWVEREFLYISNFQKSILSLGRRWIMHLWISKCSSASDIFI